MENHIRSKEEHDVAFCVASFDVLVSAEKLKIIEMTGWQITSTCDKQHTMFPTVFNGYDVLIPFFPLLRLLLHYRSAVSGCFLMDAGVTLHSNASHIKLTRA